LIKQPEGLQAVREETYRRLILIGAALCWLTSGTLVGCLVFRVINADHRPGITSLVVLVQSLAITLTVMWAQFRFRRIMAAVLKAGIQIDGMAKEEALRKEEIR
jgi:hypothetical protein